MAYNSASSRATAKYKAAHIKRIPLDVQKETYERILEAAATVGESVNGFIKKAVEERIQKLRDEKDKGL